MRTAIAVLIEAIGAAILFCGVAGFVILFTLLVNSNVPGFGP